MSQLKVQMLPCGCFAATQGAFCFEFGVCVDHIRKAYERSLEYEDGNPQQFAMSFLQEGETHADAQQRSAAIDAANLRRDPTLLAVERIDLPDANL